MLIVMKADATEREVEIVVAVMEELGFRAHTMQGATRTFVGITGNQGAIDVTRFENLPGVAEAIRVSKPYKLITLDLRPEKTLALQQYERLADEVRVVRAALLPALAR